MRPTSTTAPRKAGKETAPAKPAAAAKAAPVEDQDDQVCGFMLLADADYVSLGERVQQLAKMRRSMWTEADRKAELLYLQNWQVRERPCWCWRFVTLYFILPTHHPFTTIFT